MSTINNFDPLSLIEGQRIVSSAIKKRISNIISSYTGQYDLISEIIQNSLDALEKKWVISDSNYNPKIKVKIDLENNNILVADNGIGLVEDEFKYFLAPDISFKSIYNYINNAK